MVRAIQFDRFGGPEVLEYREVGVAEPGAGQARVRHTAVGVNFIDVYHRTGLYPLALPSGLGSEAAGVVVATGAGVTHVKPGTALRTTRPGRSAPTPRSGSSTRAGSSSCRERSTIAQARR